MDIFINSTFAQSVRGFRLMRLYSDCRFYDVASYDETGDELHRFFGEDLFRLLWFDKNGFSTFGVKGIRGVFNNGKAGFIDIAVRAAEDELSTESLAQVVFANFGTACSLLFEMITIDAQGNYSFDFDRFVQTLSGLPHGALPAFVNLDDLPDVVRFAVCGGVFGRALAQLSEMGLQIKNGSVADVRTFEQMIHNTR